MKTIAISHYMYHLTSLFSFENGMKVQNDVNLIFKTFTLIPEVRSIWEIFIVTKWTNQVILSLAYHVQIE